MGECVKNLHKYPNNSAFTTHQSIYVSQSYKTKVSLSSLSMTSSLSEPGPNWTPILSLNDLPLGIRKEIFYDGYEILLFWYKKSVYAISSRSPAEGAYSEGFIKAVFTQDDCIKCPSTGTSFSLN